jgi:hypothetical protein
VVAHPAQSHPAYLLTAKSGDPFISGKEDLTQMNTDKQG